MKRKYENPADALLARKKPKSEETKRRISEGQKRYWETAKHLLAERERQQSEGEQK